MTIRRAAPYTEQNAKSLMKTQTTFSRFAALTLLAILVCRVSAAVGADDFAQVTVFRNGEDGYKIFRIPAMVVANNGDVLAFCEARQGGDLSEIDLVLKRSKDGGKTWGKLQVVQESDSFQHLFEEKNEQISVGNPAPVVDRLDPDHLGRIWLPFTLENDRVFVTHSDDHGTTWAKPREITTAVKHESWGWYATGPVHSIQLQRGEHKGRLVVPCDHRKGEGGQDRGANGAHAIVSDDHGKTWKLGAIDDTYEDDINANETSVVELNNGRLYFNTRDQHGASAGSRGDAYSSDGGTTFDVSDDKAHRYFVPSPPELDPPVVQSSLVRAASKLNGDAENLILFCGPDDNGPTGKGRSDLRIRYSTDETRTWRDGPLVHRGLAAYSDMVQLGANKVGILFEVGKDKQQYESIVFTTLSLDQLSVDPRASSQTAPRRPFERPNVLFLCVDDMKDWVHCLGGYEGTVHTPNIDRLAQRGVLFTNAHCVSPKCAPSRAAILTGLRPSTTGLYDNGHWWLPNLPQATTIPRHFQNHGYHVAGAGKVFHHTAGNHPPNQWDEFRRLTFQEDPWFRGNELNYPWSKPRSFPSGFPYSEVKGLGHENDWGSLPISDDEYDDEHTTDFAVEYLRRDRSEGDAPFFLACGLFRPHLPWYVPQKYFDLYPLEEIVLPRIKEGDLNDLPPEALALAKARRSDFETIQKAGKWGHAVRAYLASISCADAKIGRVLNALNESPHAENTIVVLWSDHGWHLGEKQHWHKSTLWEEATRVPFVVCAPGCEAGVCDRPVSLLDIYPTLVELAGLAKIESLEGVSLTPLLNNPQAQWNRPAVIEYQRGNAAVRSTRYRYIRYRNGGEELYDHQTDPHEWNNLAAHSEYARVKEELAGWLPDDWADSAPTKKAFQFDHRTFTWTNKTTGAVTRGSNQ